MKKYLYIIAVLACLIVTSSISDSFAIYTHSDKFAGTLTLLRELTIDDFFHYEMKTDYPNSSATYDSKLDRVTLTGESGAFVQHTSLNPQSDYVASVQIDAMSADELKNVAFQFGGAANVTSEGYENKTNYTAMGNLMKFDQEGNLHIINQGFQKSKDNNDHYVPYDGDTGNYKEISKEHFEGLTGRPITIRVYVKYITSTQRCSIYIVINDVIINKEVDIIDAGRCMNTQYADQIGEKQIVTGVSSYSNDKTVVFSNVKVEPWDGQFSSVK